ncbi:MAG TPA: hypothetical protein VLI93_07225 [Acetobacteraceae bacterium]|nr:hypothetical protein [Acetobacteraceae bacterium]
MRCCFYPATLHEAEQGYVAEFSDIPLRGVGETACEAADNAELELRAYADRLHGAGAPLPPPSRFPRQLKAPSGREPESYILVALEARTERPVARAAIGRH